MPRPDDGLIHAWLDGELDAAESARVAKLVAEDAEWGAAAAEARGLIAASSRILGSLDVVAGDVIPQGGSAAPDLPRSGTTAARAPRLRLTAQSWMRMAAGLVLVASTLYVTRRGQGDAPGVPVESDATAMRAMQAPQEQGIAPTVAPTVASPLPQVPTASGTVANAPVGSPAPALAPTAPRARDALADAAGEREPSRAEVGAGAAKLGPRPPAPAPAAAALAAAPSESVAPPAAVAQGLVADRAARERTNAAVAERRADADKSARKSLASDDVLRLQGVVTTSANADVAKSSLAGAGMIREMMPLVGCWRTETTALVDSILFAPRIVRTLGDTLVVRVSERGAEAHVRRETPDALRGVTIDPTGTLVSFLARRMDCPIRR